MDEVRRYNGLVSTQAPIITAINDFDSDGGSLTTTLIHTCRSASSTSTSAPLIIHRCQLPLEMLAGLPE